MRLMAEITRTFVVACAIVSVATAADTQSVTDLVPLVDALAAPLVETATVQGLVVGLIVDGETAVRGYGRKSAQADSVPDGQTIFEIGSITKVFTGLLLAEAVGRGELELNAPLEDFLPDSIKALRHGERSITLLDLATHTSRLPRMPRNFAPADPNNPYADYTVEKLYAFLSKYELRRTPGEKYSYSNLGMGLLGQILSNHAKVEYATLVRRRITEPLALQDTVITLNDEQLKRLAQGHDADAQPVANWDLNALAGAGGLRSTVDDMLRFLQANMGEFDHPLKKAMALSHAQRREIGPNGGHIAIAWHIQPNSGFLWHNGGTGGYRSFAAFHPQRPVGVVVLSNTATPMLNRLGFELTKLLAGQKRNRWKCELPSRSTPKHWTITSANTNLLPGQSST